MAARLVGVGQCCFCASALVQHKKLIAAISVSPETNTKPKKMKYLEKRRKTPGG